MWANRRRAAVFLEVLDVFDLGSSDEGRIGPPAGRRAPHPDVDEVYEVASGVDDCGDLCSGSSSDRVGAGVFDEPVSSSALTGVLESLFADGGDDFRPSVVVRDGVHPLAVGWCGHVLKVPLPFGFSGLRGVSQIWDKEFHDSLTPTVRLRI